MSNQSSHLQVHTLAQRFYSKKAKRVVIRPRGELKLVQPILRKSISDRTLLHPNHYGVTGRSPYELIFTLMNAAAEGFCVGSADIFQAFLNVSQKQLSHQIVQFGIPENIHSLLGLKDKLTFTGSNQRPHRGLPQGFNTSSLLFAHFMEPALRRMNNGRYKVFLYADNLFWIAPNFQTAKKCLKYIEKCLSKRGLNLHKEGKKGAKIFRPEESFVALGLTINVRKDKNMMSDAIHSQVDDEPIVKTENARHCYNSILKLKKQAALSQSSNVVSDDLELLAPTTHIQDTGLTDPGPNQWFTLGYEQFPDSSTSKHWGQRFRIIESGTARLNKVGLENLGAVGGSLFSTYSKSQQNVMRKLSRSLMCAEKTCRKNLRKFLEDPLKNNNLYPVIRDELWALYIPFSGIDTLTKIVREQELRHLRQKYIQDSKFAVFIRSCYVNELNLIHHWAFAKDPVSIASVNSKSLIQQILRGYATAKMVLISQRAGIKIPHLAEFEAGLFRFPILGFNDGSASEIQDIADACEALACGFAVTPVFKQVMDDLIQEKIAAFKHGELLSHFREPIDFRVRSIYVEQSQSLAEKFPQVSNLPSDLDKLLPLWSSRKLAAKFKMPNFQQQIANQLNRDLL